MRESFQKLSAILLIFTPILFLVLSTIAMYLFPGSYALSEELVFYSPFYKFDKNFFSDLGMLKTAAGWSNIPSAILFCVSMTILGIAFILHSISFPSYFTENSKQHKYANLALICGIIAASGFIGVGFTPWDILPHLHDISVLIGFGISMIYCLFFGLAVLIEKQYPNFYGILSFSYIVVTIAYAFVTIFAPPYDTFPGRTTHVIAQKVVVYYMMALIIIQGISSLILIKKKGE
jgi:hypothetical protein